MSHAEATQSRSPRASSALDSAAASHRRISRLMVARPAGRIRRAAGVCAPKARRRFCSPTRIPRNKSYTDWMDERMHRA
eukprot:354731-Chlamydomonas_euryale.AAC.6